jgi:hypothetical protein
MWGSGCIYQCIFDLGGSWIWVVSFTSRPLYPRGKRSRYPLDRRLSGQKTGLDNVERRKIVSLLGFEVRPLGSPARSQSLYRLRYFGFQPTCEGRQKQKSSFRIVTSHESGRELRDKSDDSRLNSRHYSLSLSMGLQPFRAFDAFSVS